MATPRVSAINIYKDYLACSWVQCKLIRWTGTTLELKSRVQVPLKYKGEVEVEGIKIQYDGLYITVILPNGIMVTWDGIISTQVGHVTMVTGGAPILVTMVTGVTVTVVTMVTGVTVN